MRLRDNMETLAGIDVGVFRSGWAPGQPHS